jgi:5-methylcytosine-specific restriction endonuclease McrA
MTEIAPPSRKPVEATKRLSMGKARRERILAKHHHKCSFPGCEVAEGLELDHQIALFLGGKDADDNIVPLCRTHHAAKTQLDHKLIGKVRRILKKGSGEKAPSRIKSRGFDKTKRKRMDGTVVSRLEAERED